MPLEQDEKLHHELDITWKRSRGFIGWLASTNHKDISLRYIITAFVFFALAGLLAFLMRLQLAFPENRFIGPDLYNQLFSVHGTTMMFIFAVPVMEAVALYFIPMMVGTRNVAFPRLNSFGYFTYLFGCILLYTGLLTNVGPDAGWFAYPPLSGPEYAAGKRVDVWSQMITLTEIAALVNSVQIICTVFKLRSIGMILPRIPVYVWAMIVTAFMTLFAMPAVMVASGMLAMDRLTNVNTHFFNPAEGGDVILYQHIFWFFGHPEVYLIFIPATGFVSTILPAFCRRPIFGYLPLVLSLIATAFIGFGLWVHHMFATPLPHLGQSFFSAASMVIAIPAGVQIFCWIATLWTGRPQFKTPLLFVLGFVAVFVFGGLSGVMLASVPLDLQLHDTYFVVAHFHYVLIGGALFPLMGALYYWFPKWSGRLLDEKLGKIHFWSLFVGFNLTFFPMHLLGMHGMTRRIYTYPAESGWGFLNLLATIGAGVMGLSMLLFLFNILRSRRRGEVAGDNPWDASTLEWALPSPPPSYNFLYLPVVQSRDPLWQQNVVQPQVTGLASNRKELLSTTLLDAQEEHRYEMKQDSLWPLLTALVTGSAWAACIFTPWALPVGAFFALIALGLWFWRDNDLDRVLNPAHKLPSPLQLPQSLTPDAREQHGMRQFLDVANLPAGEVDHRSLIWWGNFLLLLIETVMFGLLIAAYFYLRQNFAQWPPPDPSAQPPDFDPVPALTIPTVNLGVILLSVLAMVWADRSALKRDQRSVCRALKAVILLGLIAIALRFGDFEALKVRWDANAYGSIIWLIVGMHLSHLIVGVSELALMLAWILRKGMDVQHARDVRVTAVYWYWVAGMWLLLYAIVFIGPRFF
ncbi:MAG: cytochrome oxidase [Prosthecobacter sp.]|nr:cytochrome oxidase [Prosthecobacter sp.]